MLFKELITSLELLPKACIISPPPTPQVCLILNIFSHFPAISQLVYLHLIIVPVLLSQTNNIMTLLFVQSYKGLRANDK